MFNLGYDHIKKVMSLIRIKRADFSDALVISLLGKTTFTETFGDLFSEEELSTYLDETFGIEKLERSLLKGENIFGILYYQDNPVGYYKIKMGLHFDHSTDEHCVQLQKIYLLRDYLDLKLGKEMLNHIFKLREIKECNLIWLIVLHTNNRAIRFYEHQGFKKLKKYHHQIGLHDLEYELMTKGLPA
jgi:ribosomal protein S18 acetylase RimI-like enzyme